MVAHSFFIPFHVRGRGIYRVKSADTVVFSNGINQHLWRYPKIAVVQRKSCPEKSRRVEIFLIK